MFDLSNFEETVTGIVDGTCPADLECGPADRWHEDARDEIMSRISFTDVEDLSDAVSRLEDWRDDLGRGDLAENIHVEIVYSADCDDFVREYENECDEAVHELYGSLEEFVLSVSPQTITQLLDSLANVGIDHVFRGQLYEWVENLSSEIDDLIVDIESAMDDDDN